MTVSDPYKVLQVDPGADDDLIEAAFKRLAKRYHPDVTADPEAQARMVQLNLARAMLRDPVRRAAVDRARVRADLAAARVAASAGRSDARHRDGRTASMPGAGIGAPPEASPLSGSTDWPSPGMDRTGDHSASAWGERATGGAWPVGRSDHGHGYDQATMGAPQASGSAGPPAGKASGSLVHFGRYAGWTLGQIARVDPGYLEWLDRTPIGRGHQSEIDALLRQRGIRTSGDTSSRHGLSRRR